MSDLFKRANTYDDLGNLNVSQFTEMDRYSKVTLNLGNFGPAGTTSITSMFNWDAADYYYLLTTGAAPKTGNIVWDMYEKRKIRSILCSFYAHLDGGAAASFEVKIQGSNNNTDWTDLDTSSGNVAPDVSDTLVSGDVNYRYIRLLMNKTDANVSTLSLVFFSLKILV